MALGSGNDGAGRRGLAADAAFERVLLESARDDGPPDGATTAAWAKLSASLGPALAGPERCLAPQGAGGAGHALAAKWALLGALAGSALTASWFSLRPSPGPAPVAATAATAASAAPGAPGVDREPAPAAPPSSAARAAPPAPPLPPPVTPPAPSTRALPVRGATAPRAAERRRPRTTPPVAAAAAAPSSAAPAGSTPGSPAGVPAPPSTLEREVRALDAVRTALADERPGRALRLVASYRSDFPDGALAREADLFEIEAYLAQGDRVAAEQHADAFLLHHPTDVHAARARALLRR
ncbi:MAG TPA: hypothetical protein VNN80_21645 [Polyangiaceae bacterium]|nr:hypothetical protein [Polyangiaceae bacterium]